MEKITHCLFTPIVNKKGVVHAWEEEILLPTYEIGTEEKNPIFLEKRVYQGSSGAVYPYPVVEKISDEKKDKPYRAFFLENEYLKIMILPQLGGRVQLAYDKIRRRPFVYYNQVVKPALVGLTGPWISGGIEFNFPQHHRPSTFLPVDCRIEEHADGSKSVWCNEIERMSRLKDLHGFRLYPSKAYLEINVQVYNRTPFPQTFLWWVNPAVVANDDYKSIFPPDVHAVFDHGKRDVSTFPIAKGIYYKQDYSAGVDISRYKNIPVPTSYMAVESKYDFVGGYDDSVQAGLLHVANHHVSPGKKQWTWGNGDFGQAWDRNLTDEDGPYIELMTGVYTDNQPDFSWLSPYEEKSWQQYFMPYAEVGYVKNANKNAIINVECKVKNEKLTVILYTTSEYKNLHLILKNENQIVSEKAIEFVSPENPCRSTVEVKDLSSLRIEIFTENGELLIDYILEKKQEKPIPQPAKAAKQPSEIEQIEQLYLTGMHLEQYRHATCNPLDYYFEALQRDAGDIRCNNAVGLLLMRQGKFEQAEPFFRSSIATLIERNPNPYDGEPYYNLGWCLKMQGKTNEAYKYFFKSVWNAAWQDAGYFALAQIDCLNKNYKAALDKIEKSLIRNGRNHKARALKAVLLRKTDRKTEAQQWIYDSLKMDKFNIGCLFEKKQLDLKTLTGLDDKHLRLTAHDLLEYAFDYADAGFYEEAEMILRNGKGEKFFVFTEYPIVFYALAYFVEKQNDAEKTKEYYRLAMQAKPDYCFPNKLEEVVVLKRAIKNNPADPKAPYYLGNFYYASHQYDEAVALWERSVKLDGNFPTVLRNLALAYYNKRNNKSLAQQTMEKAFVLDASDARILMELDQLYKKIGKPQAERLAFLEKQLDLVEQRDDLCIERITLYNQLSEYKTAKRLISARRFHPWEGGEGKVTGQYLFCCRELAKQALEEKRFVDALSLLKETEKYPENLGEGKLINTEENDIDYYRGLAYRGLDDEIAAVACFENATRGSSEPQQAFFYNDQQPDRIYYQGLAFAALDNRIEAEKRFRTLIEYGEKHLNDECRMDYFAVSLPDLAIWDEDLNERNKQHCRYMVELGKKGFENFNSNKHL
jgi:tetratricopeptide (TPR) repeat protein